jgi:8-hydroxy-5-deazaflavin:NADPH oxidoreductase
MKIGILGTGNIGKTLVRRLPAAGHDVKVANSRGPETIDKDILMTGARAVTAEEALADVDVVILSIPLNRIPDVAPLVAALPEEMVVIDTSNYYPGRDDRIAVIDEGQVESLWVAEKLGRPIAKAWNAIGAPSFAQRGKPKGSGGRIAIPVAADRDHDRRVTLQLVEETGLDAFDAGSLAESWRQQPGSPAYCTDLTLDELAPALAAAKRDRLPARRDLVFNVVMERMEDLGVTLDDQWGVRLSRIVYM